MDLNLWLRLLKENDKIYSFQSQALAAFRIWEDTKTTQGSMLFLQNAKEVLEHQGAKKFSKAKLRLIYITCRIWAGNVKRRIVFK